MRVLHVLDISVPMLAGYTSRSRYLVNHQKALGIEPIVLTSVRFDNPKDVAVEEIDGIRYYRTRRPPFSFVGERLGEAPVLREGLEVNHLRRRIVEVARGERPDIIHAHSSILCGIPGYLAARQLGLPFVYEIRAFWEDAAVDAGTNLPGSPKYVAIRSAETHLAGHADALIGICQGIKRELIDRGIPDEDVFVVPNGVDTQKFKPMPRNEEIARKYGLTGKTVVAYIGTFAAFEGVRFLEEALVRILKGGRDDVRGLIVGEGATYEACRQIAAEAGLADKILHPGKVPHAEVQGLYSISDILAYPRDSQRITELVTPLKPLEAMAMEKAVIGSDVGGLLELIRDGVSGLIFRHEDATDLARKILELVDSPDRRAALGRQARAEVEHDRDWRRIVEGHRDVYARAQRNWRDRGPMVRGIQRGVASMMDLARL